MRCAAVSALLPLSRVRTEHANSSESAMSNSLRLELVGRRKDGSEFPVDISLRPVLLGETLLAIGAVRDMSEQRHAERERTQLAERLRLQAELIELSHGAILLRDPTSRVIFWNNGAEELYGWTEEAALGRITHSLLQTCFPVSLAQVDGQLEREGRWEGELVHTCRCWSPR